MKPKEAREVSEVDTMAMPLEGGVLKVTDGYEVELPEGDHLVLTAGGELGTPGARYDDAAKVAAWRETGWEVKHYGRGGRKWWTQHAGVDFYFVIAKASIRIVREKGYSYVPVVIRGLRMTLNVSGGGGGGTWTDYVRRICHTSIRVPMSTLKCMASAAWSVDECRRRGATLDLPEDDDGWTESRRRIFELEAARIDQQGALTAGRMLVLANGYKFGGSRGPFEIEHRRERGGGFICRTSVCPTRFRVGRKNVDWLETAKANGLPIRQARTVNRIAPAMTPGLLEVSA